MEGPLSEFLTPYILCLERPYCPGLLLSPETGGVCLTRDKQMGLGLLAFHLCWSCGVMPRDRGGDWGAGRGRDRGRGRLALPEAIKSG